MAQDIRLLAPTGPTQAAFEERLLGELYVHDPSRPEKSHLVGRSAAMVCLAAELKQFSCSDIPVLLCGESGTGKELCAKTLHEHRGKGISLPVNCASLKPDMIESELFGHVRGAFTGANTARQGLLLDAGTGTCFLDEIGELDLRAQAALLRVIEEREVRPVGSSQHQALRCRLVMATHRNLAAEVEHDRFRRDLYHRISPLLIRIPPLRERKQDIPLLVDHFINRYNREQGSRIKAPEGYDLFFQYNWPGNVRELRGLLYRAMIGRTEGHLSARIVKMATMENQSQHLLPGTDPAIPFDLDKDNWPDLLERARKTFLEHALKRCGGVNESLERILDCKKTRIYRELKKFGISN